MLQSVSLINPGLYASGFTDINIGRTCLELYGSDFKGFAQSGLVWASELSMNILSPQANLVGSVYYGAMTMGQLPSAGLTVQQLIQQSQTCQIGQSTITLRGAVTNHSIVYNTANVQVATTGDPFVDLSMETIHYAVLVSPVISVTTGAQQIFSLMYSCGGNYLFFPKPTDPFASKLGSTHSQASVYLDSTVSKTPSAGQYHSVSPLYLQDANHDKDFIDELSSHKGHGFNSFSTADDSQIFQSPSRDSHELSFMAKAGNFLSNAAKWTAGALSSPAGQAVIGMLARGLKTHRQMQSSEHARAYSKVLILDQISHLQEYLNPLIFPRAIRIEFEQWQSRLADLRDGYEEYPDVFPEPLIDPKVEEALPSKAIEERNPLDDAIAALAHARVRLNENSIHLFS